MTAPAPTNDTIEIRKEIRFAVVLYGGVSLAVYIGGIAREMLAMVRATALETGNPGAATGFLEKNPTGSAKIYREVAAALARSPSDQNGNAYARFVVDVISGTSAGGLNGVFLAKALARAQTLDHLRRLWLSLGDIVSLLNTNDKEPRSVLNGTFMLDALEKAFDEMESQPICNDAPDTSLVDDVVCFATTTDLSGLPIAIRHADKTIVELRNKHFYRFQFSNNLHQKSSNEFERADNPALALASRSTSAFPAAFAPLRLADKRVKDPPKLYPPYGGTGKTHVSENGDLPPGVAPPVGHTIFDAYVHAFADGGILNNKPFAHAIGALASRRGGRPSERRLLYVEPSPDTPINLAEAGRKRSLDQSTPGFLGVIQSSFALPSRQTIREDLERVIERNRTIDRMNGILADVPAEIVEHHEIVVAALKRTIADPKTQGPQRIAAERLMRIVEPDDGLDAAKAFSESDVGDMLGIYGLGYGGYHRLAVASVTDDISRTVARLTGIDDQSDEFVAIRALVRAWRDLRFAPYVQNLPPAEVARKNEIDDVLRESKPPRDFQTGKRESENAFLFQWDARYRLRRLEFALNKIDDLACLDDRGNALLRSFRVDDSKAWMTPDRRAELARMARVLGTADAMFRARVATLDEPDGDAEFKIEDWVERMRAREPNIDVAPEQRRDDGRFVDSIAGLEIAPELRSLLDSSESERSRKAIAIVALRFADFDAVATRLAARIKEVSVLASAWANDVLPTSVDARKRQQERKEPSAGDIIRFFYDNYESIDRIRFPVFYQSSIGEETDTVAVMRISPEDAEAIVENEPGKPRRMLAGETLGHFGGFFAKSWRANDFLWGQLDGAERLITAACLGASHITKEKRLGFIAKAQAAILAEEANIEGLPHLGRITGDDRGERRLAWLREKHNEQHNYKTLLQQGSEFEKVFVEAIRGALPILGRIFKRGEPGVLGKIGAMVGGVFVFIARSAISRWRKWLVRTVGAAMILGGIVAIVFGLTARRPEWWPGSTMIVRYGAGAACFVGGAILGGCGHGLLVVRRKMAEAFERLRKQIPA